MRGLSVTQFVTVLCSTAAVANTHTHSIRQSVCFVTIAGSFVRAIKRVSCSFLFYFYFLDFLFTNHSILRVWMYINVSTFFPPFLFLLLLGLLLGLKGRVKTEAPNVPDREPIQRERGRTRCNKHNNNDPTVENIDFDEIRSKKIIIIFIEFGLSTGSFSSFFF
jgi:hypothetical protein